MTEEQLKKILNAELADFLGKQATYFDKRFDALQDEIKGGLDQIHNTVDGIAQRLDDDATEQAVANSRHEDWIKQLAENTGTKLVPKA